MYPAMIKITENHLPMSETVCNLQEKLYLYLRNPYILLIRQHMKVYSLLCLPLVSFAAICACKPSHTAQVGKKITEMGKKEQIMLEDAKPKSEEEALENYFTLSRKGVISWVLTDTATLSYPFTQSIEKEFVTIATSDDQCLRTYSWDTGGGGTMIRWGNLIQYRKRE